jgi:hypothetical protein
LIFELSGNLASARVSCSTAFALGSRGDGGVVTSLKGGTPAMLAIIKDIYWRLEMEVSALSFMCGLNFE